MYGRETIVQKLLSSGVNLDIVDKQGANALNLALINKHLETAFLLIKAGISVHTPDKKNRTPLMLAVSQGSLELTKLLIDKGFSSELNDRIFFRSP